jgi:hypothetical protein
MNITKAAQDVFDSEFSLQPYLDGIKNAIVGHGIRQGLIQEAEQKKAANVGKGNTRFSTDYAIRYCRSLGWKLMDRERFDYRLKRHFDTFMGSDAMFDTPDGIALVQAGGKCERAEHYRRFVDRGGIEMAQKRHWEFIYMEFVRGSKTPILEEKWA